MSEQYEHNLGDHEDPIAGPTWTVGIAGGALLVVTMLGIVGLFYDIRGAEHEAKIANQPRVELQTLKDEQAARLVKPPHRELRNENADAEALVIPIEQAMDLLVGEAGGR